MPAPRRAPGALPEGFHVESPDGGLERPSHVCENIEEVLARFDGAPVKGGAVVLCGWCWRSIRTRNASEAVKWFRSHECEEMLPDYGEIAA